MELILLLAGLVGLTLFTDGSNDDSAPETPEPEPETPEVPVEPVTPVAPPAPVEPETPVGPETPTSNTATDGDDVLTVPRDGRGGSLNGLAGDDLLQGRSSDDMLIGGDGMDTLIGGGGNDNLADVERGFFNTDNTSVMNGGRGDDVLQFEDGSTVTGGDGADRLFMYDNLDDTLVSRITDFDPAEDALRLYLDVQADNGGEFRLDPRADATGSDLYLGDDLVAEIQSQSPLALSDIEIFVLLDQDAGTTGFTGGDAAINIQGNLGDNVVNGGDAGERILMNNFGSITGIMANSQGGADYVDGGAGNDTITGDGADIFQTDVDDRNETIITLEQDTLIGGAGDDVLLTANGNILTGGSGADLFGVRPTDAGGIIPPTVITDFDITEDSLVLEIPSGLQGQEITVVRYADGTGASVLLNGNTVVQVTGGQDLTPDDIEVQRSFLEYYASRT